MKYKKILLPHEIKLLESGKLKDITHERASAVWLEASSSTPPAGSEYTTVYRVMGDTELLYLLEHNALPATQPYQAIMEGENGRKYAEKYLRGHKRVDTAPTTVVEFTVPTDPIKVLFASQHKAEDGAISTGLGNKGGDGLELFNSALAVGSWRIVLVKRSYK